jgi:hypothetical protein
MDNMEIGSAVMFLKDGKRVRRASWDSKLWLVLESGSGKIDLVTEGDASSTREWNPGFDDLVAHDYMARDKAAPASNFENGVAVEEQTSSD